MHAIGATLKTSTVILADDHPLVRRGVRSLFQPFPEYSIVAEAEDGFTAVELVERWSPDVLIVDITMPGLDGMEVTRRAAQRCPEIRSVILSMHEDEAHVFEALRAGVAGYLSKTASLGTIVEAIRAVGRGDTAFPPGVERAATTRLADLAAQARRGAHAWARLTPREREVLSLIASGMTSRQIASSLGISERTVESYVSGVFDKLGVRTRAQAVREAVRLGLVEDM